MGLRVTGDQSLPVRTLVRTGCLISRRGRTDGAGVGLRGRIAGARIAQIYQPGGVPAKISGRQGINPDRNQSLKNLPTPPCPTLLRPAVAGLRRADEREFYPPEALFGWASTSPNKFNGLCDSWVQAVVNGTTQCGRFQ